MGQSRSKASGPGRCDVPCVLMMLYCFKIKSITPDQKPHYHHHHQFLLPPPLLNIKPDICPFSILTSISIGKNFGQTDALDIWNGKVELYLPSQGDSAKTGALPSIKAEESKNTLLLKKQSLKVKEILFVQSLVIYKKK